MNHDPYWLTRISPLREALAYRDWTNLGGDYGLDPYGQHRLIWQFFDGPRKMPGQPTPFLFRAEVRESLPLFYVLSKTPPRDTSGKWLIEAKKFNPALEAGDRLAFKLRVNPVVERPGAVVLDADGKPKLRRSGARAGQEKYKVLRHDVVMDAKRRMGWNEMPPNQRPSLALVAYEAGNCWLRDREEGLGFRVDTQGLRVDSYATHCLKGRRDESGRCRGISLSTLDFEGVLTVTGVEAFTKTLLNGIGPAKSFGCGLILVRRVEGTMNV